MLNAGEASLAEAAEFAHYVTEMRRLLEELHAEENSGSRLQRVETINLLSDLRREYDELEGMVKKVWNGLAREQRRAMHGRSYRGGRKRSSDSVD